MPIGRDGHLLNSTNSFDLQPEGPQASHEQKRSFPYTSRESDSADERQNVESRGPADAGSRSNLRIRRQAYSWHQHYKKGCIDEAKRRCRLRGL